MIMITVIKHGKKKQITCSNCGCVMEYEKEDVKAEQVGMNEYDYSINCPDCKSKVKVNYWK